MKKMVATVVLGIGLSLIARGTEPLPFHPPVPAIAATRAIELASRFAGSATNVTRYCSSIVLNEGSMIPAPRGSARHWVVTFQDAGGDRAAVTRVYVDMEGRVSDVVPPMSR
jgi:hypothetical protein